MMAALISRADAMSFVENGEGAMLTYFPLSIRIRELRNPQTSAHSPGTVPGPHNGGVPGDIGKAQSAKASSMMLILLLLSRRHGAPLKSPTTKSTFSSSITARIARISLFTMPRFLTFMLLMCNDKTVNVVFGRWEVVDEKKHVIARLVRPSLSLLQPPHLAVRA